jgi:aminomethyltransferase
MGSGLSKAFEQRISLASHAMGITLLGYGLSALEACRLEAGFIVAGWDCATEADPEPGFERSPFELDIGWLVNLDAAPFVGRDALIKQKQEGGRFVRRSFKMSSTLKPEDGANIWGKVDSQEIPIGSINCSSWSWGLNNMIGNASIIRDYGELKQAWLVVDNNRLDITLSQGPLLSFERQKKTPAKIY